MAPSSFIADRGAALAAVVDPAFLRKLDRLRLTVRHSVSARPGNTPMPTGSQASGMELTNYKDYTPGDDTRYVDWNAYGRLDTMLIKRFRATREAPLDILIDVSASMNTPAGDGKLPFAIALAASLAYISLRQQDPVRLVALGRAGRGFEATPLFRHIGRFPDIRAFLGELAAEGSVSVTDAVDAYARAINRPGIAVVLSDFLVPAANYERALELLRGRSRNVAAVRVLGPIERDPANLPRRARLRDVESGGERLLTLTPAHRARYAEALAAHLEGLERWCKGHAVAYLTADPAEGLERCVLECMPRSGMVH